MVARKQRYKVLPPHSYEAHPLTEHGEISRPLFIAVIAVLIAVILVLVLFVLEPTSFGRAIYMGDENTAGLLSDASVLTVGDKFRVTAVANIGSAQTVAASFSLLLPEGISCFDVQPVAPWSADDPLLRLHSVTCSENVVEFVYGTLDPTLAKSGIVRIAEIYLQPSLAGEFTFSYSNVEMYSLTNPSFNLITESTNLSLTFIEPTTEPGETQDTDADGIEDLDDNCPTIANPAQSDSDYDSIGDLCDEATLTVETVSVETTSNLQAVWGTSATDIWVAGDSGVLFHKTSDWDINSLDASIRTHAGWGSSLESQWLVAEEGIILHYNGTHWNEAESGTDLVLVDVLSFPTGEAYAVGQAGTFLKYNGTSWNPLITPTSANLVDLWGTDPNNVYAVGFSGVILHYDGDVVTEMDRPTSMTLRGIWGTSDANLYVVGSSSTFLHYNGSVWENIPSGIARANFFDIWGSSADDIYIVGDSKAVLHFDGIDWTRIYGGSGSFLDVWGSGSDDVYAVGSGGAIIHIYPIDLRDSDGDGVNNEIDNCLLLANPDQADADGDGLGDVCDVAPTPDEEPSGSSSSSSSSGGGGGSGRRTTLTCGEWTFCNVSLEQSRTCVDRYGRTSTETQACEICQESWVCTEWSACSNGQQQRTCADEHICGTEQFKPRETQNCAVASGTVGGSNSQFTPPGQSANQGQIFGGTNDNNVESTFFSTQNIIFGVLLLVLLLALIIGLIIFIRHKRAHGTNFDELKQWIKEETDMGASPVAIEQTLARTEWRQDEVVRAFHDLHIAI